MADELPAVWTWSMASTSARPRLTSSMMPAWKARRLPWLASLKPSSAAAFGEISVPARAISVRMAAKAAASFLSASKSGRSAGPTMGSQAFSSASIAASPFPIPSAYLRASARSAEA